MEILWLVAIAWIAFAAFGAGALGYSLAMGEPVDGFKSVIGVFFAVTWVLFFYLAVPAFAIGLVVGVVRRGWAGQPSAGTSAVPETGRAVAMPPSEASPADVRTKQLYRLWQATRTPDDWRVFAESVRGDLVSRKLTLEVMSAEYPDAVASAGFREWAASLVRVGPVAHGPSRVQSAAKSSLSPVDTTAPRKGHASTVKAGGEGRSAPAPVKIEPTLISHQGEPWPRPARGVEVASQSAEDFLWMLGMERVARNQLFGGPSPDDVRFVQSRGMIGHSAEDFIDVAKRCARDAVTARRSGELDVAEDKLLQALDFCWKAGAEDGALFGDICNRLALVYEQMSVGDATGESLATAVCDRAIWIGERTDKTLLANALLNRATMALSINDVHTARAYALRAQEHASGKQSRAVRSLLEALPTS